MKKIIIIFGILLLSIMFVLANEDHESEIEEGRKLVESKVDCDDLNDEQLEAIGEYYMEQMHPGEAHEAMHEMMGIEEGTEYHKQVHVNMAKTMYCGGGGMMGSGGMMGMMPMMMGGGNMMAMMGNNPINYNSMGFGYNYFSFWNIIWILFWIGIIVLVIWFIYKFIMQRKGDSLEILKKRYAKGEINKKQFEEMKKEIG